MLSLLSPQREEDGRPRFRVLDRTLPVPDVVVEPELGYAGEPRRMKDEGDDEDDDEDEDESSGGGPLGRGATWADLLRVFSAGTDTTARGFWAAFVLRGAMSAKEIRRFRRWIATQNAKPRGEACRLHYQVCRHECVETCGSECLAYASIDCGDQGTVSRTSRIKLVLVFQPYPTYTTTRLVTLSAVSQQSLSNLSATSQQSLGSLSSLSSLSALCLSCSRGYTT